MPIELIVLTPPVYTSQIIILIFMNLSGCYFFFSYPTKLFISPTEKYIFPRASLSFLLKLVANPKSPQIMS